MCLTSLKNDLVINDAIVQMDTGGKKVLFWQIFFLRLQIQNELLKSSFPYSVKQTAEFSDLIPAGTIYPDISEHDVESLTVEDHITNLGKTVPG